MSLFCRSLFLAHSLTLHFPSVSVLVPAKKPVAWTVNKPETIVRPAAVAKATLAACAIVEEEEEEEEQAAPIAVLAPVLVDTKIAPVASHIKARNIKKRSPWRTRSRSVGQQDGIKRISVVVEENAEEDWRVERRLRNRPESLGVEWKTASWFVKGGSEMRVEDLWEREEEEVEDLKEICVTISFGIAPWMGPIEDHKEHILYFRLFDSFL